MIEIEAPDFKGLFESLHILSMPPAARRLWLSRMGRMAIAQAQKNIRDQKSVDGSSFTPRKRYLEWKVKMEERMADGSISSIPAPPKSSRNDPMLVNSIKGTKKGHRKYHVKFEYLDDSSGRIFYPDSGVERTSAKHQYGSYDVFRKARLSSLFSSAELKPSSREYWQRKCNKRQAVELIRCGYRVPAEWIMEHMTVGHAYEWFKNVKSEWKIDVPSRPFLGMNDSQKTEVGKQLMNDLHSAFKAKNYNFLLR